MFLNFLALQSMAFTNHRHSNMQLQPLGSQAEIHHTCMQPGCEAGKYRSYDALCYDQKALHYVIPSFTAFCKFLYVFRSNNQHLQSLRIFILFTSLIGDILNFVLRVANSIFRTVESRGWMPLGLIAAQHTVLRQCTIAAHLHNILVAWQ